MQRSGGYSLIEVIVVVSLLGFLASVMIPAAAPYQDQKLDLAATELTNALRFARDEAIRTGQYRAITINKDTGQVTVGQPAISGGEVTGLQSLSYNPIDKKVYDFNLNTLNKNVVIDPSAPPFTFQNLAGARDTCLFDAYGAPLMITTAKTYVLTAGSVVLKSGVNSRAVAISLVGRVTVQ
jgi:prepilin-type N-terminal cleavage/methylation domain-containing protein